MFVTNSNTDGFSVKAWIGDAKTLLAFNFTNAASAKDLAGFSICIQPHGLPDYYQLNNLVLPTNAGNAVVKGEQPNSTANAPIQKFRWLHVPGNFHQGEQPFYGIYKYTVTPRYFNNGVLKPLDPAASVTVEVQVQPFSTTQLALGFTRGFVQSQAFVHHFGANAPFRPAGKDLVYDTSATAGKNDAGQSFTYAQEYDWSGFTARTRIFDILNAVIADTSLTLDVFAYDLNEPDVVKAFLQLAAQGRMRIILDNASLHSGGAPEDVFEKQFRQQMKGNADILRGKFGRYAHDKVFIVYKDKTPVKVLTGSTNFSVTGMYVNSNHVLVFDNPDVASLYSQVFNGSWDDKVSESFSTSQLAGQEYTFNQKGLPKMAITFSPHTQAFATSELDAMSTRIGETKTSVLFAVMDVESGGGSVLQALQTLHKNQQIFSYGITDAIFPYLPKIAHPPIKGGAYKNGGKMSYSDQPGCRCFKK